MDAPIEFITTGQDGVSLDVNPKAIEILDRIDKALVIVAVVGKYRTGKSFLFNLLTNKTDGFPLGSTVEAATKGIWLWVRDFPGNPSKSLLLLDTEGLHDPKKGSISHDTKIFTLAILLSSVFVYNSTGVIDANSMEGLYLASELSNHVRANNNSENQEEGLTDHLPDLIWAVRDHFLELKANNQTMTPNEYLEDCLKLQRGQRKEIKDFNHMKETVRFFFKQRTCFVFPLPTVKENLTRLDKMRIEDLDSKFIEVGKDFTEHIKRNGKVKNLSGKNIHGKMFANLAKEYVKAIVDGSIDIQSTYEYLVKNENTKAIAKALEAFKAELDGMILPCSSEELDKKNAEAQSKATETFVKYAISSDKDAEFMEELETKITDLIENYHKKNYEISLKKCENILHKLSKILSKDMQADKFAKRGGSALFKTAVEDIKMEFQALPENEKGPAALEALRVFQDRTDEHYKIFVKADDALTKKEKEYEFERAEKEAVKARAEMLTKQKEELERHHTKLQSQHEENLRVQREEFERQQEKIRQEMEMKLKHELEERERLLHEGFEEQAKMMQEEIEATRQDMKRKEEDREKQREEMQQFINTMMESQAKQMKEMREAMEKLASRPVQVTTGKSCTVM